MKSVHFFFIYKREKGDFRVFSVALCIWQSPCRLVHQVGGCTQLLRGADYTGARDASELGLQGFQVLVVRFVHLCFV